jgi:hypothetical protein
MLGSSSSPSRGLAPVANLPDFFPGPLDNMRQYVVHAAMFSPALRALCVLLLSASVAGAQFVSGDWGYSVGKQGRPAVEFVTITNYLGPAGGNAVVPSVIDGKPVRGIGNGSASIDSQSRLASIVVPDSVTAINQQAFYRSTNLANVSLANGLTTIGLVAFYESGITSIVVPDTVTSLGTYAFSRAPRLTNVVLGVGVTNIGQATFADSPNLRRVVIPPGVKDIGDYAFNNCFNLASAPIPQGVTNIGFAAFSRCFPLTNIVIPDTVRRVGDKAFNECVAATDLVLGAGLTNAGLAAFAYVDNVKSVVVPPGLTNIPGDFLLGSVSLSSVILGPGVKNIGDFALGDGPSLQSVLFKGNIPNLSGTNRDVFGTSTNVTVFVLPGTTGWGPTFAGRPTLWFMPRPIQSSFSAGSFGFGWTGSGVIPMNVQRRASLVEGDWSPIATGVTNAMFADTNTPSGRAYYRAALP